MSEITREGRLYAKQCRACGELTTAAKIEGLCDWSDMQQLTINEQRKQIRELEEIVGLKTKYKGGANFREQKQEEGP